MNIAKIVRKAREQTRLTALDFATGIFDDFIELHGDRSFRDDGAIIGGIGQWLVKKLLAYSNLPQMRNCQSSCLRLLVVPVCKKES